MIEIKNWDKLDNWIISTGSKMYKIYVVEKPHTEYWEDDKKKTIYSMVIEEQFDNNVYSANLMIRETDWCVDRTEIVLEMQHLKGINKSFYLVKRDIMDLYDFTNTITKIVSSIDEQLIELQRNLKRLNLNP